MHKIFPLTRLAVSVAVLGCAFLGHPSLAAPVSGPDDIFLSSTSTIEEYTSGGQHVRSIPVPANTGSYAANGTEYLRGLAVTDAGQIVGFNGTFSPQLVTYDPSGHTFTSRTSPGWDIANNVSSGSVGVSQGYTFALSDNLNSPHAAVLRFNPDGTSQQFGAASDYRNYINLTVGLDGRLYVLYSTGTAFLADVYDPASLQLLRTVTLQVPTAHGSSGTDLRNLAVDASGSIYAIELYNYVYHLDPSGALLQSASHGHGGYTTDIKIDPANGRLLISVDTNVGVILQTDSSLSTFTTLIQISANGSGSDFIAFGNAELASALNPTTHVLWDNADGRASVWNQNPADGTYIHSEYGPFPDWTAKAVADGPDGLTRLLWDKADGTMSLWSLDNAAGQFTFHSFGPYPGWTAQALSVGAGNSTHILWTNTDGRATVWNYDTAGGGVTQNVFGPYPGWTAKAVADGPAGATRLLWDNANGQAALWSLDTATGGFSQFSYGPYAGWTANALSVGTDGTAHLLWDKTDGRASVWNQQADGFGSFTQKTYGPFQNWSAKAVADGLDGSVHLLWDNTNGAASIWSLDSTAGVYTQFPYGPFPTWTAVGLSAGH